MCKEKQKPQVETTCIYNLQYYNTFLVEIFHKTPTFSVILASFVGEYHELCATVQTLLLQRWQVCLSFIFFYYYQKLSNQLLAIPDILKEITRLQDCRPKSQNLIF